jgi:intein/homing endonuclease
MNWIEKEIEIQEVKQLLLNNEIEVFSLDGYVSIEAFVEKGMWDEYKLIIEDGRTVSVNENHLFETDIGWVSAKNMLNKIFNILTDNGIQKGVVKKTGKQIPIVDIKVGHSNQRYFTNGISSHNTGKTLFMCHMASANLLQGKNVLYITMEMAEERIAERIDANLLDTPIDELSLLTKDVFRKKINRVKNKTVGKLIVKEYPTAQAGSAHFKHLINELKLKRNFIPDIIYIDYLNICMSSRLKMGSNVNSYTYVRAIAEELRGLAIELGVPVVSATQVNREGFTSSDFGMENVSECIYINEKVKLINGKDILIKDISIGDQITSNDIYKTVVNVHHKKRKKCVKITLSSGKTIIVSKDHVFPTFADKKINRLSVNDGLKIGDTLSSISG